MSCAVLRRLIRAPVPAPTSPSWVARSADETFKTGRDLLAWDRSQARTFGAICRHATLTALVGTSTCLRPRPCPGNITPLTCSPTPAAHRFQDQPASHARVRWHHNAVRLAALPPKPEPTGRR